MDELARITRNRKTDHIDINLHKDVQSLTTTGFELFRFVHNPLPELDLDEIETGIDFLGKKLRSPLLISSMTGGTPQASKININLALAAESHGIALALGSGRPGLESDEAAKTYGLRKYAPTIPIFANLGAVQLNYGCGVEECKRVVEIAQADALILHFNSLQEALQPEGQTNFKGILNKIGEVCKQMPVPVIAKEVGWGFSAKAARDLVNAGIACIDIAGAGGTSWSEVEKYRNQQSSRVRISSHFRDWGNPTALALEEVCAALPKVPVIASGGLRNGLDIAKSLVLGAGVAGMAGPFIKAAVVSSQAVAEILTEINLELRIVMFAVGARNLKELKKQSLIKKACH